MGQTIQFAPRQYRSALTRRAGTPSVLRRAVGGVRGKSLSSRPPNSPISYTHWLPSIALARLFAWDSAFSRGPCGGEARS
jgi:hypothetical protein